MGIISGAVERAKSWLDVLDAPKFRDTLLRQKANGTLAGAFKNVMLAAAIDAAATFLVLALAGALIGAVFGGISGAGAGGALAGGLVGGAALGVWGAAVAAVFLVVAPLLFFAMEGAKWGLARALGGNGTFSEQCFFSSIVMAARLLIGVGGMLIPCAGGIIAVAMNIYAIYLGYLVIRDVHRLGKARAAAVMVVELLLGICIYVAIALWAKTP